MNPIQSKLAGSPALARALPFLVFVGLTAAQGMFGEGSRYWVYAAKTVVGAWMVWAVRPLISEMRWKVSWEAVVAGVAVFAVWVGLDGLYPKLHELFPKWFSAGTPWNPYAHYGEGSAMALLIVVFRIVGSTLVVPPLEEAFYRSFLYRWIARPDFQSLPLGHFSWKPFLATAAIFGLAHAEWLAGILCAFAYQGLVIRKNRLGDAMTAHAITNLLLGLWVVWRGAWQFW